MRPSCSAWPFKMHTVISKQEIIVLASVVVAPPGHCKPTVPKLTPYRAIASGIVLLPGQLKWTDLWGWPAILMSVASQSSESCSALAESNNWMLLNRRSLCGIGATTLYRSVNKTHTLTSHSDKHPKPVHASFNVDDQSIVRVYICCFSIGTIFSIFGFWTVFELRASNWKKLH